MSQTEADQVNQLSVYSQTSRVTLTDKLALCIFLDIIKIDFRSVLRNLVNAQTVHDRMRKHFGKSLRGTSTSFCYSFHVRVLCCTEADSLISEGCRSGSNKLENLSIQNQAE